MVQLDKLKYHGWNATLGLYLKWVQLSFYRLIRLNMHDTILYTQTCSTIYTHNVKTSFPTLPSFSAKFNFLFSLQ